MLFLCILSFLADPALHMLQIKLVPASTTIPIASPPIFAVLQRSVAKTCVVVLADLSIAPVTLSTPFVDRTKILQEGKESTIFLLPLIF